MSKNVYSTKANLSTEGDVVLMNFILAGCGGKKGRKKLTKRCQN